MNYRKDPEDSAHKDDVAVMTCEDVRSPQGGIGLHTVKLIDLYSRTPKWLKVSFIRVMSCDRSPHCVAVALILAAAGSTSSTRCARRRIQLLPKSHQQIHCMMLCSDAALTLSCLSCLHFLLW